MSEATGKVEGHTTCRDNNPTHIHFAVVHSRGEERNAASPEDGLGWGKEIWGLPYLTSALEKADRVREIV